MKKSFHGDSVPKPLQGASRLRAEAGRFPDTMDQRYGGWAQLLTLFRLIYEGGSHADLRIPPRKGYLFDPDRYPFIEGRTASQPPTTDHAPRTTL